MTKSDGSQPDKKRPASICAPFLIGHSWKEITWPYSGGSVHCAVLGKARELGAVAWDYGQAKVR